MMVLFVSIECDWESEIKSITTFTFTRRQGAVDSGSGTTITDGRWTTAVVDFSLLIISLLNISWLGYDLLYYCRLLYWSGSKPESVCMIKLIINKVSSRHRSRGVWSTSKIVLVLDYTKICTVGVLDQEDFCHYSTSPLTALLWLGKNDRQL